MDASLQLRELSGRVAAGQEAWNVLLQVADDGSEPGGAGLRHAAAAQLLQPAHPLLYDKCADRCGTAHACTVMVLIYSKDLVISSVIPSATSADNASTLNM